MKTEVLDKCLELFRWIQDSDDDQISFLADLNVEFKDSLIEPFRRELGINLLAKATDPEKQDLIIFYIEELDRTILFNRDYKEIRPVDIESDGFYYPIFYEDQYETDPNGIAEVRAHFLFSSLFAVIQDYCNIYHIPFLDLCRDRHFILETINLQPTRDFEELTSCNKVLDEMTMEEKLGKRSSEIGRPVFAQEYLHEVYEIIRDFFSPEDQASLLFMLENSSDVEKLLVFLDTGNRLADAFKQLYDANIILGCQKKELESWICRNFAYVYQKNVRLFIPKYLNEIISTTKDKCKRPFLDVRFDKTLNKNILIKL